MNYTYNYFDVIFLMILFTINTTIGNCNKKIKYELFCLFIEFLNIIKIIKISVLINYYSILID